MTETEKVKAEALRLRAEGTSVEEIVERTGLGAQEVVDILAEEQDAITTMQGIKEEAALISSGVSRRERLKKIVSLRNRVEEELDKRDFSDIPTEKLPALLLKINEAIREEVTPPRIISSPLFNNDWEAGRKKEITNI